MGQLLQLDLLRAERLTVEMEKVGPGEARDQQKQVHGVTVMDRQRTWTTSAPSGGGGGGYGGTRDFGPNGHDYEEAPDADPNSSDLSEEEIHGLIAERLQAKLIRDFDNADRIMAELREAGVNIDDRGKQWRADGAGFPMRDRDGGGGGGGENIKEPEMCLLRIVTQCFIPSFLRRPRRQIVVWWWWWRKFIWWTGR